LPPKKKKGPEGLAEKFHKNVAYKTETDLQSVSIELVYGTESVKILSASEMKVFSKYMQEENQDGSSTVIELAITSSDSAITLTTKQIFDLFIFGKYHKNFFSNLQKGEDSNMENWKEKIKKIATSKVNENMDDIKSGKALQLLKQKASEVAKNFQSCFFHKI